MERLAIPRRLTQLRRSRVSGTIKNDIISVDAFVDAPSVLMLGMLCALIGSSLFLTFATRIGLPVSTTHCIIGGIIGVGFATVGPQGVDWSWEGVSQVFAAWAIAPCISAAFGAILFLFTKYGVMKSKNPLTESFLVQLDVDLEGTGLRADVSKSSSAYIHQAMVCPELFIRPV